MRERYDLIYIPTNPTTPEQLRRVVTHSAWLEDIGMEPKDLTSELKNVPISPRSTEQIQLVERHETWLQGLGKLFVKRQVVIEASTSEI